MKEGDVALAAMPQADGARKHRPVLLLREMPPHGDMLACGISTQLQHEVSGFDERITPADSDFADTGLIAESLIRLGFLAVLPLASIAGAIGAVAPARHRRLLQTLSNYLLH